MIAILALLFIPQTSKPIKVFVNRIFAFSPSEIKQENRNVLTDYNWRLKTLSSEEINLSKSKGKVIIINFWATWCPPCIAEMPSFQKLYDDYGSRVDFYFVSSEEIEKLQKFIQTKGYTFPVYLQNSESPEMLQSNSLPTTYVISKEGEIIIKEFGSADWNSDKTRKLLDELLNQFKVFQAVLVTL